MILDWDLASRVERAAARDLGVTRRTCANVPVGIASPRFPEAKPLQFHRRDWFASPKRVPQIKVIRTLAGLSEAGEPRFTLPAFETIAIETPEALRWIVQSFLFCFRMAL